MRLIKFIIICYAIVKIAFVIAEREGIKWVNMPGWKERIMERTLIYGGARNN